MLNDERVMATVEARAALADLAYAAMMVLDLEGHILFWNREAEHMYGWTAEEAYGKISHDLLSTEADQPLRYIKTKLKAGGQWQGELRQRRRDGSPLTVLSRWAMQRNTEGTPEAILEVNIDIGDQKRAEVEREALIRKQVALAESEAARQRLTFLSEAATLLASSLDYSATLESVARLAVPHIADWCTIDMVAEDGSIQLLALAHIDPDKVRWAYDLRQKYPVDPDAPIGTPAVLRTGKSELYSFIGDHLLAAAATDEEQLELLRAVGYASAMVVPLISRGRVLGAINLVSTTESARHYTSADLELAENLARHAALAIDNARLFGEVQRLNQSLQQRAAVLEAANQELESFTYSVSHDLRAPLRAIDGFSRILQEDYSAQLEEEALEYLKLVRENAQKMNELIDRLLAFSRLGRQVLVKQRVDPAELVERALAGLQMDMDGRPVEVEIHDLPPCDADPGLLEQVYVNLLSNALKFTRGRLPARIEVGSRQQDAERVYYVRDNGVGFDMRYADKLFGVFQRLHRAEDYEGTGAGLAIVKRIVLRHGGRVWAESTVGEGATFFFTIPG